jgi:hypothetical protein
MMKILITLGVAFAVLLVAARLRAQRRRDARLSELNKHPERLEQMLDPTDDA